MGILSRRLRPPVLIAVLSATALVLSCFDAPVRHELDLFFNADGSVEVREMTSILPLWRDTDNRRVAARLDAMRDAILHEQDLWSRAVRAMKPVSERISHEFEKGLLVSSTRQAVATDPRAVEDLFAPTPVSAFVRQEERTIALELVPSGATRATYRQRRKVEEATERFAASVARYLGALAELYAWLDEHPEEERTAMSSLLDVSDEDADSELSNEGRRLVESVDEVSAGLLEVLEIRGDEAYTLDELSRMAYDPFPAPVAIEVAGDVLESRGFVSGGDRRFVTRHHSLWDALSSLSERWVTPLPVVAVVTALRADPSGAEMNDESLLDAILAVPRRVDDVPGEVEVRAMILQQLQPPKYYRLRWSLPAGEP